MDYLFAWLFIGVMVQAYFDFKDEKHGFTHTAGFSFFKKWSIRILAAFMWPHLIFVMRGRYDD